MRQHLSRFLFSVVFLLPVHAQVFSAGVKGGAILTDPVTHGNDHSGRYTVGPYVELKLPFRLAVEFDALYKHIDTSPQGAENIRTTGNSWEFPILGKYYFDAHNETWKPYLSGGLALRKVWYDRGALSFSSDLNTGGVVAGGIAFRSHRLEFSPELRYTRWAREATTLGRSQAELLLGIRF